MDYKTVATLIKSKVFFAKWDGINYFYKLKIKEFLERVGSAGVAEPAYRQAGW